MTALSHVNININWHREDTSFRLDILCLIVAIAVHVPLFFIKMDMKKKAVDVSKKRLMSVDLINPEDLIKKVVPPPPPIAEVKAPSLAERLKALVHKAPPPPKPVVKVEPKALETPKEIRLEAKPLTPLKVVPPTLQAKEGFKTNADANLVKESKLNLKAGGAALAPLSERKLGVVADRNTLKTGKENFKIAQGDTLQSIDSGGKGIADPSAPRIAIQTGKTASTEKFSAPAQKADKGSFAGGAGGGLNPSGLSLKDQIIARDAPSSQIGTTGTRRIGMSGGGAIATKQDAGRFEGGAAGGVADGVAGGTLGGVVGGKGVAPSIAASVPVAKKKKEMFQLTGELKDRARIQQVVPEYPDWAQQKGIEAAVIMEFSVEPGGNVKDNIVVIRTSGYPELDELAKKALRKWKFVPLADGENRTEVGRITFNYTLS